MAAEQERRLTLLSASANARLLTTSGATTLRGPAKLLFLRQAIMTSTASVRLIQLILWEPFPDNDRQTAERDQIFQYAAIGVQHQAEAKQNSPDTGMGGGSCHLFPVHRDLGQKVVPGQTVLICRRCALVAIKANG